MFNRINIKKRGSSKGFSIVELIIALAITAIAIVAIYNLFIAQQKGFMLQEQVSNMQQNNRVAMEELSTVVKMAGVGVLPPQQKILYCGPYDFVFSGNLNNTATDAMSSGATVVGGLYTAPDPTTFNNQDSETYRWTLDKNQDGLLNANDYSNTTTGARQYSLWKETYTGGASTIDEITPGISINDLQGNQVVLFQYWGEFDADIALDLWGDTNQDGELQAGEIISNSATGALDPIADLTGAGRAADDMLKMVDVTVITETQTNDKSYPTNAGFRQTEHNSMITPRNLWSCANIEFLGWNPLWKLKITGDNTNFYGPFQFRVTESGVPKQNQDVTIIATIVDSLGVIRDINSLYPNPPNAPLYSQHFTTDASGLITVSISSAPICDLNNFYVGGVITVTATIPADVTPFGPCSADSATGSITLRAGDPSVVVASAVPLPPAEVLSCGDTTTWSFNVTVQDSCGNTVPATTPITLEARGQKGGATPQFGTLNPNQIPIGASTTATPVTYTSPLSGPYDSVVDRSATNPDRFEVRLVCDFPNPGTPLFIPVGATPDVWVELFPDHITNFDPLTNPITATDHTDCNNAGMKTSSATFNIEDSCGNQVYDLKNMQAFNPYKNAQIEIAFTPDPLGVLNLPTDQGTISAPMPPNAAANIITTSTAGDYMLTYTEPSCTLPPLYTRILQPTIAMTPTNFKNQANISLNLNLHSCTDCEIVTSTPTMSTCESNATANVTDVPGVTVVFCGIQDGTPVELEITSSKGAAQNASFDRTNPNISSIIGTFTSSTFSAPIYIGNATNGAQLTVTAYSPTKATYLADPAGFTCSGVNLITVSSLCKSIRVTNEIIQVATPDITAISANDKIYIEVDDCNQNKNSAIAEEITVTVTSPQGFTPPAPDVEDVILKETGPDTGIFNSNTYVGINTPGPLSVIYCGIGSSGDISGNGMLFVRPGYDVTVQYTDPNDPLDNACKKILDVNVFSCPAFVYSYFGASYIHLDRHGIAAPLALGGNIFTNGEFELSGDMTVDGRGPDGLLHTADDYLTVSLGHMSLAGHLIGDTYSPSIDLKGPEGNGQNAQTFAPNTGVLDGDAYLMDGWKYDSVSSTYSREVIGSRGNSPTYGNYTAYAANAFAAKPPLSNVIVYPVVAPMAHNGATYPMPSQAGYPFDPNLDSSYALPLPNGKVIVAQDLPNFDYAKSVTDSKDMTTRYHATIGQDTYFTSMAEFKTFLTTPRTYTALDGTTYTSPHINAQGKTIYIVGDPYEGTPFHFTCNYSAATLAIGVANQIIIHGAIIGELQVDLGGANDGGMAIYGCGSRPKDWIEGWTGATYADYSDWLAVRGGEEDIPYDMMAVIGKTKFVSKSRSTHIVIEGIVYSNAESHFHDSLPQAKQFVHGAEIANVIHNCLYMDFKYNDCVRRAAAYWFGCYCDSGGAAIACQLNITPSSATITKGGNTVTFVGANSINGTYSFAVSGTSGGSISAVGDTVVYTSGPNIGTDTVTVSSVGCMPASATINVIDLCDVTITPNALTIPITQSQVLVASSLQGGPFNWSFDRNDSGGNIDITIGDATTYTAGMSGGVDIIRVTDDGGCRDATITISVDDCYVVVDLFRYSGGVCTATPVDNVTINQEVCVSVVIGGDPDSTGFLWLTDEPGGQFYDDATGTWVDSGVLSSYRGDKVRYKAAGTLGTYTITAKDDESCVGTRLFSTCDISLAPETTTIYSTQTVDFTAWIGPALPARNVASWTTTDLAGAIAITGPINATYTPSAIGNYTVTITDNVFCTATASVRVIACPGITISPTNPTISYVSGGGQLFTALGGTIPYTWTSSNPAVGTIDALTGMFTPLSLGTTIITARDGANCAGTTNVTVQCPTINVEPAAQTVTLVDPVPNVLYGASFGTAPYAWTSSNVAVATINPASGTATILGTGTTTIKATDAYNCQGTTTLTVSCPVITINPTNPAVLTGSVTTFTAANGTAPYSWTSSSPAVGAIDAAGVFTALATGATTITATDAYGCTRTTVVTVNCPVITIAPASPTVIPGSITNFGAVGGTAPYTWTSSAPAVGTIDAGSGAFTALTAGSSTITARDANNCAATTVVTVTCPAIAIAPATPTVTSGTTTNFSAGGGTAPYTWTSSNTTVGTIVAATGVFTAKSAGTTTVTARDASNCATTTLVTVTCPAITVNPNNPSVVSGTTTNFSAVGGTEPYTWTSSNTTVGTIVAATGAFTAKAAGTTTVTARDANSCTKTSTVTVTCPTITLSMDGGQPVDYSVDRTRVFTASGGTSPYTWNSSNTTAGTIVSTGATTALFTGMNRNGSTTVRATDANGCIKTLLVTVQK